MRQMMQMRRKWEGDEGRAFLGTMRRIECGIPCPIHGLLHSAVKAKAIAPAVPTRQSRSI